MADSRRVVIVADVLLQVIVVQVWRTRPARWHIHRHVIAFEVVVNFVVNLVGDVIVQVEIEIAQATAHRLFLVHRVQTHRVLDHSSAHDSLEQSPLLPGLPADLHATQTRVAAVAGGAVHDRSRLPRRRFHD